ncbi:MAG: reverse transcriptase domain-containing protein, partial [Egibacteraceae bacterium]
IVQMAAKLVLEPILETDFCPISYGFRPGRRTQDAVEHVRRFINAPSFYEWVIEGDVEDCFGSIHHGLLLAELRRRVTDKRMLRLVRQFLGAGIMREHGSPAATPSGAPQGAILSPLLANVALSVLDRHFEAAWNAHSSQERSRRRAPGHPSYRMIRYADDFVRHEAPCDRAEMQGLRRGSVAAGRGRWGQPELGDAREGGSSPDNDGTGRDCQTAWVRQSRRDGVTRVNQWQSPVSGVPALNLADMGRSAACAHRSDVVGNSVGREKSPVRRPW